jgi:hypothetical protein
LNTSASLIMPSARASASVNCNSRRRNRYPDTDTAMSRTRSTSSRDASASSYESETQAEETKVPRHSYSNGQDTVYKEGVDCQPIERRNSKWRKGLA